MQKSNRYRLKPNEIKHIKRLRNNEQRILVIGDLHAPFIKKGYLEHAKNIYNKYNCNKVIFIGDCIDSHYSSFHAPDPDGYSAGDELQRAIDDIAKWYDAFPVADVCIGNHDAIICRKAFDAGISNKWIKSYSEVLNTPNWQWDEHYIYNNVYYVHGTGSSGFKGAYNRMVNWGFSVVQGHLHTECSIMWKVDSSNRLFSMQIGCGVDDKSYAMAYAKNFTKKYIISVGVVLDNGRLPILEPMIL
jgi:predicted phosphodiesterase